MKIILATDLKNGISKNGRIPWYRPQDLSFFKKITIQTKLPNKINAVIMGRKTWETLPNKFLPNRINIVLTRKPDLFSRYQNSHLIFAKSIDDAERIISYISRVENIWIIGGAEIYKEVL